MSQNYNELVSKLNSFIREYYKNKILKGFIYSFYLPCYSINRRIPN